MTDDRTKTDGGELPLAIQWHYHTAVFIDLGRSHNNAFVDALTTRPRALRDAYFLPQLPDSWSSGEVVWSACSRYLENIEQKMSEILSRHSVYFWLHLYRRIGVELSPRHEGKTDPSTVGLVRRIAELAIVKQGSLGRSDDLCLSSSVKFHEVLGGHYRRVWRKMAKNDLDAMLGFHILRRAPQWVVTSFNLDDLIDLYEIEGLSYEYWRTMALMRSVGKGSRVKRSDDGWAVHAPDAAFKKLIDSYDERITNYHWATLAGTWSGKETTNKTDVGRSMVCPQYNTSRLGAEDGINVPGVRLPPKATFVPNFLIRSVDIQNFFNANKVLSSFYLKNTGYQLETLLTALWGLANIVLVPSTILYSELGEPESVEITGLLTKNLQNVMQRGYSASGQIDDLPAEILRRSEFFEVPLRPFDGGELTACLTDLTLTSEKQRSISLWSGGPRYPIIPFGENCAVVDTVCLPWILHTCFVRIRHNGTARGTAFEEEFRAALSMNAFKIEYSGELIALDGSIREVDASLRISNSLYLFECVSIERPLDFEVGKISTIEHRIAALDEKVEQVLTLREFLRRNLKGRNYDLSWVENIFPFVVSPFVEWVWSRESRLWHDSKLPRIIAADEALRMLEIVSSQS